MDQKIRIRLKAYDHRVLDQSAHEIVETAIEEDVQGIAVSSYQGGHMEFFKCARTSGWSTSWRRRRRRSMRS